jgi:hypothetical protein
MKEQLITLIEAQESRYYLLKFKIEDREEMVLLLSHQDTFKPVTGVRDIHHGNSIGILCAEKIQFPRQQYPRLKCAKCSDFLIIHKSLSKNNMTTKELLELPNGNYTVILEKNMLNMTIEDNTDIDNGIEKKICFTEYDDTIFLKIESCTESHLMLRCGLCGIELFRIVHHSSLTIIP